MLFEKRKISQKGHLLSLVVIRCHSLSFVITCCYSLSLVISRCTTCCATRCHSLTLVVTCHSLSLDVSLACLFVNVLRCLLLNGVKSLQIIYFSQHSYCLINFLEKFLFFKQVFHLQKLRTKYSLSSSHAS